MNNDKNRYCNQDIQGKNDDHVPWPFYPEFILKLLMSKIAYFYHTTFEKAKQPLRFHQKYFFY